MSIKDKIAIILIILTIILFGIAINGSRGSITYIDNNGKTQTISDLNVFAELAANSGNTFMNIPVSSIKGINISGGQEQNEIYYRSGICTYKNQGNKASGVLYNIVDVLDFSFNSNGIQVSRNGSPINTNETTGTLAKALYSAYSGLPAYEKSSNQAFHNYKQAVRSALINAINSGGITADSSFYTGVQETSYYSQDLLDNAYGVSAKNYVSLTKNSQDSLVTTQHSDNYTMIGPFNLNFAGKGIEKIQIKTDKKEITNGNGGQIYFSTYFKKIEGATSNVAGEWSNSITDIPSGNEFYIIVADNEEGFSKGNNLNITFYQQGMEYYHARLILAVNPKANGQNFSIYAAEQNSFTGQQTYGVTEKTPIDLNVVKSGNNSVRQGNVKFYLRKDGTETGYAKWGNKVEQNGKIIYSDVSFMNYVDTSSPEVAEKYVFVTGTSGEFTIKNLDVKYTYSLQEFENPNQGYTEVDIKDATLSNGLTSVSVTKTKDNKTNNLITGIKLNSTQSNVLYIVDRAKDEPIKLTVIKSGMNNIKQENVKFYLRKDDSKTTYAKWGNKVEKNGEIIYSDVSFIDYIDTSSDKNAEKHVFVTGKSGKFIVENLDEKSEYSVQEIENPNEGYKVIDIKSAELSSGSVKVNISKTQNNNTNNLVTGIRLKSTLNNILNIIDKKENEKEKPKEFNIYINKVNTSGSKLKGAEFKIKVFDGKKEKGWLYYNLEKEEFDYNNKYSKSTTWSTSEGNSKDYTIYADEQGIIEILGLNKEYDYKIYEFKQATNYLSLLEQTKNGMKVSIDGETTIMSKSENYIEEDGEIDESVYCGTVSYDGNGASVEIKVTNVSGGGSSSSQYLYISGIIWQDTKQGKQYEYNDLYDSDTEELFNQTVKVSLVNSSGKTVKTLTTKNGKYNINTGITIKSSTSNDQVAEKLEGYYLKFEYSDEYSPVAPNFENPNGSKALIQDKEGIAYIYNLSDYVELFYEYKTLDNMNMGLFNTEEGKYEVNQSIAYVKVVINGYTYTYEYGGTGDKTKTAAPTVKWQRGNAYTRLIYPSDIAYSNKNNWDENSLKVFVVYRIDINNTEVRNYGKKKSETKKPVSYVEVDLRVTNLTNDYDEDRYELETKYDEDKNKDFGDWKDQKGVATYTGDKLDDGLVPNTPKTVYIQFKVKKKALMELLDQKETYEKEPTMAKTEAYHNYWKAYYKWSESKEDYVLKIKDMKTSSKIATAKSDYLKLTINTERTITGRVFEDEKISTNGEHLGDGKFENNENTISNVKVELVSEDGSVAKLYYNKDEDYVEKAAETKTNTEGTYAFVGVTPGKYYVRFTYGDGTQKICTFDSSNGKYKETRETIQIADYKSTVINNNEKCIRSALGYEYADKFKAGNEWYKHEAHPKDEANKIYSTATDDLTQRAKYNENNASRNNIQANTALMSVGLENTTKNYTTISKSEDGTKETILGINFGIIQIPEVSLAFDKVVSYIQITNTQGNILAEGNPASKNIKYVSDLDKETHLVKGSQYTKSEINEEELYGSQLKLTYSITVQNNSEVNYYENNKSDGTKSKYYGYYYKFGDKNTSDSKEVTVTIDNVLDYIDPIIKYEHISIDDKHKINKVKALDYKKLTDEMKAETRLSYDYIVKITKWEELFTTKNKDMNYNIDKTQDTAELTVTRLLSSEDDDLGVSNVAKVIDLHITNTPTLVETIDSTDKYFNHPVYVNPTEEVYVTITPPTGADTLTVIIYIISSIISLGVITIGIIFIKRKVLHK